MQAIKIYTAAVVLSFIASCTLPVDEGNCDYERLYPEISDIDFTVDGSEFVQNVSNVTFEGTNDYEKIYEVSASYAELYFTHIDFIFDEDCSAEYLHRIFISLNLDQGINETKTYPVALVGTPATASYVFQKDAPISPASGSTITITRFVPENYLEGSFDIQFGERTITGNFDLNLKKTY